MSFYSTQSLQSILPQLIDPYDPKNLGTASYDLTLGEEVYITALSDTRWQDREKVFLKENATVSIPPGQFAYLITEEVVNIPTDKIALINFKFNKKASGLLNVSGFHVDPGYKGKLIFATYNAGGGYYDIKRGEKIFTIWLVSLDKEDENPRIKDGYTTIPTGLMNNPDRSISLQSLDEKIRSMDKRIERYSFKQGIIWVILIILFSTLGKYALDTYIGRNWVQATSQSKTAPPP